MSKGLKDVWQGSFKVGAAVDRYDLEQKEADAIIKQHFSSLTAGSSMKFGLIHPEENVWDWEEPDYIANYARKNRLVMRGHTIIWHNQNAKWIFLDNNETVSKSVLFKRLEDHIFKITQRYNDIIYAWDVLNEVIDTDKGDDKGFRLTGWYKIGGKELYETAFKLMREAAPNSKLFYNDYNNEFGKKMDANIRYLSELLDAGIPVDGIGIQAHCFYNFPDEKTLRTALQRYSALGLDIEITELDISIYEWEEARDKSEFLKAAPLDRIKEQSKRYIDIFRTASEFPLVKNITTWGIADNNTWLDHFPVLNRKNWPLLFDEHFKEKEAVTELLKGV